MNRLRYKPMGDFLLEGETHLRTIPMKNKEAGLLIHQLLTLISQRTIPGALIHQTPSLLVRAKHATRQNP